ncbi:alkaline phosphatase D family protein [Tamlana sp. 2201CG12-4]|uniref:alkaline phosphatase D family protein n=1 Tax=Tamlana sp. 2201CG12-4 TaxID=3112582 RepID=UPI002DBC7C8C|nr:alkaline phosphatase D family protein [Tamlana sp. 2201CG12-4]MEC3906737.1 alkaline phosphatase D family protein [Tamlana sp. 2201CG12-4]
MGKLLRQLLLLHLFFSICSCNHENVRFKTNVTSIYYNDALKPFYHGVASGDPTQNEVVLWTRITPDFVKEHEVKWMVSSDSLQKSILQEGIVKIDSVNDYTVKVLVSGLKPDTYYWYSFEYKNDRSIVGRTKTLTDKDTNSQVNLIGVSCNAYEGGYFNAFRRIAERKERIDAVVHLGDYIYESFIPKYIKKKDRVPLPKKELISLEDYRTRYAQYHLDSNLMLAHQMHPFINIWDDHEIANDSYADGAGGHNKEDGSYKDRMYNAKKAFYEWLPIKEDKKLYRSFNLGGVANLFMIDGRLEGRTKQGKPTDSLYNSSKRKMLGDRQMKWLVNGLNQSKSTWKIIGNPVLFSKFDFSPVMSDINEKENDSWSGYPFERSKFISLIDSCAIDNLIFLSGDSHSSWVIEVQNLENNEKNPIAIEFGVPSISSENWDTSNPVDSVIKWENRIKELKENRHIKYVNLREHGYTLLTLSDDMAMCTWYFIDKDHKTLLEEKGVSYRIKKDDYKLNRLK